MLSLLRSDSTGSWAQHTNTPFHENTSGKRLIVRRTIDVGKRSEKVGVVSAGEQCFIWFSDPSLEQQESEGLTTIRCRVAYHRDGVKVSGWTTYSKDGVCNFAPLDPPSDDSGEPSIIGNSRVPGTAEDDQKEQRSELPLPQLVKTPSAEIREHSCALCLELMWQPVRTPCEHAFCITCLKDALKYAPQRVCPLCRSDLTEFTVSAKDVDKALDSAIREAHPKEYAAMKTELEHREQTSTRLEFIFGNTHRHDPDKKTKSGKKAKSNHCCGFYVKCRVDGEDVTEQVPEDIVESVNWKFWTKNNTYSHPPYGRQMWCWGTWESIATVNFHPHVKLKPLTIKWENQWEEPDGFASTFVEVDRALLKKALSRKKTGRRQARSRKGGIRESDDI